MPKRAFRRAVEAAEHLSFQDGLGAIKRGEGGGAIRARAQERVLGSACMDDDCRKAWPNAARWDYVVGYARENQAVAHFIEVHGVETGDVSEMEKKLRWLLDYLQRAPQTELANLRRELHWVAASSIRIPKHTPQYKKLHSTLRKLGLRPPVKSLELL